ncbi:MAG: sodium:proton antiporter [Candidatus Sumerlaeia bacterium]|nr:sodium:proton antiporter [Candidatus Sumerlaeia bacterium]
MAQNSDPRFPEPLPHDDAAGVRGQARDYHPGGRGPIGGIIRILKTPATWVFALALAVSWYVGRHVAPTWSAERVTLDVLTDDDGRLFTIQREKPVFLDTIVPLAESPLRAEEIARLNVEGGEPAVRTQVVVETRVVDGQPREVYYRLTASRHWRFWSLLPALVAVALCWITREPMTALFGGIVVGAFVLGRYDLTDAVLVTALTTRDAVGILILYLWLLGGLIGIWSRTGAAQAFAQFMSRHFVRGPRSAKLVAWMLGIVFFQGGTMSAVLVGTTVKPLADENNVSHEELSYIVDSTSSPIAGLLAFNAWPGYVQAFLFVPGVAFLATEADRLSFFFRSLPFSFYCLFAVFGTFLLCIDKAPVLGGRMRRAIRRARETGELDAPEATPLAARELQVSAVPVGYTPHIIDFFLPLVVLIGIAVGTFVKTGGPQVRWAFGAAVLVAMGLAIIRGMTLLELMTGFTEGLKGVVLGSVILMLAVVVGTISKETGGGLYLVELLGGRLPYWLLPLLLLLMAIVIAFSTGTSWGTYAVTFPLAMPLAWAIANAQGLDNPELFLMICFGAVLNGGIFGDQCSPISDTTVLSSMCTGCDLMDHVKTQIPPACTAGGLAAVCWTLAAVAIA